MHLVGPTAPDVLQTQLQTTPVLWIATTGTLASSGATACHSTSTYTKLDGSLMLPTALNSTKLINLSVDIWIDSPVDRCCSSNLTPQILHKQISSHVTELGPTLAQLQPVALAGSTPMSRPTFTKLLTAWSMSSGV